MPFARTSRNRFVSSGPRSRLYAVWVKVTFVRRHSPPIPRGSERGPPGGGRRRSRRRWNQGVPILVLRGAPVTSSEIRLRSRGHLSPTVPRSDYHIFIRYECYHLL